MATFSWSDTLKISFKSCSSCLWANSEDDASLHNDSEGYNPAINNIPRARPDELQGLLADVDSDVEAERMSLHSNPGVGSQRKRKKNRRKSKRTDNARKITLFGYNLFGRPPVQLADDTEDALYSRRGTVTPNTQSTSSSAFDSDAAPLGREAIAALSSPTTAAAAIEAAAKASAELEVQRVREKEERRRRRQEKKEKKRIAAALASQGSIGDGEFEGFQGSGGDRQIHPGIRSDSGSESRQSSQPAGHDSDNIDDTAADLDGGLYSRKTTAAGSSNGGSGSRSRTSASAMSDSVRKTSGHRSTSSGSKSRQKKLTNNNNSSSSSRTAKSRSSATSQPPSLPSPRSPTGTFSQEAQVVSPSTVEQGQGFFDLEDEVDLHKQESSYIPITGFTSASGGRKANNVGVFLAQRGEGDNESH